MSFTGYKQYVHSGVEWLGQIPSHWTVKRYRGIFRERDERSMDGSETLLSVSAYTGVRPRNEVIEADDILVRAESLEGYKVCYPNDLVVNIMLAWNRGLAFTRFEGVVSPAYSVFRLISEDDPVFLNYLVRADEIIGYFGAFSSGVIDSRLRLYPDVFGTLFCALPDPAEQKLIANFLDQETAKIDALIEEQRRLIELLKEKRQAVISHAVTKGIDPSPSKPSGSAWLGTVPEKWTVYRLGSVCRSISTGPFGTALKSDEYVEGGIPVINPSHICDGLVVPENIVTVSTTVASRLNSWALGVGDVVAARRGELGRAAVVTEKLEGAICGTGSLRIRTEPSSLNPDLLVLILSSSYARAYFHQASVGATMPNLNEQIVSSLPVAFPSNPTEQQELLQQISDRAVDLSRLLDQSEAAVRLLEERRAALISAAVTGKIDVRNFIPSEAAVHEDVYELA